jgi:hypothetical protein
MFINPQARRLGDLAAGTMVVHDKPTVTLESLAGRSTARHSLTLSIPISGLPVERLSSQDIQIAEDFLRRRGTLVDDLALSHQIATMLLRKMEQPETSLPYPVNLIRTIVEDWRLQGTERAAIDD